MKVSFLQYDIKHDLDYNFNVIERYLNNDFDLLVLPELSMTGYVFDSKVDLCKVACSAENGIITKRMLELSKKYAKVIIFGMVESDNDFLYNTAVIVDSGKYIGKYRKQHLSDYEKNFFDADINDGIFTVRGIKIGVSICFDLWFPEIYRKQLLSGVDLFCVLANFGSITSYNISLIRATENMTPLILANRVGIESNENINAYFLGNSVIIKDDGTTINKVISDQEYFFSTDIDFKVKKGNLICKDLIFEINKHY